MENPILSIPQFDNVYHDFYYSDLATHLEHNKQQISKPHGHDFYLCVIFQDGTGVHEIDFVQYPIAPGTIFFLRPGQNHFWSFDSSPQGHIFFHSSNFFELLFPIDYLSSFPFFYSYHNKPCMTASKITMSSVDIYLQDVAVECRQESIFRSSKILSLINLVYIILSREYVGNEDYEVQNIRNVTLIHILEKKIEQCYREEKTVDFYSSALNLSSRHLNRIIKETVGKSAKNLILAHVMTKAKSLLVTSDKTVLEISEQLGFKEQSHFSKLFKAKELVSPKDFRAKYLGP